MPRVTLANDRYCLEDFSDWLTLKRKKENVKLKCIGDWLGITSQAVGKKIDNHSFTLKDVIIIFHKLEVPPEEIGRLLTYK